MSAFEDRLTAAIEAWKIAKSTAVLRGMMIEQGFPLPTDIMVLHPSIQPRFGSTTPDFCYFDLACPGVVIAPSWDQWTRERAQYMRRYGTGAQTSGTGSTHRMNAEEAAERLRRMYLDESVRAFYQSEQHDPFAQAFRQARDHWAFEGAFRGARHASPPPHKRVDLSGGDCVEAEARVVDDNPNAPLARPERMKP